MNQNSYPFMQSPNRTSMFLFCLFFLHRTVGLSFLGLFLIPQQSGNVFLPVSGPCLGHENFLSGD
jgi:hypothetical protein